MNTDERVKELEESVARMEKQLTSIDDVLSDIIMKYYQNILVQEQLY